MRMHGQLLLQLANYVFSSSTFTQMSDAFYMLLKKGLPLFLDRCNNFFLLLWSDFLKASNR